MEGLSVAASSIAVVSLTIQLVDSIREIQRFLRLVSDAPKELNRLLDLLEQLELILESIRMLVEKQRKQYAEEETSAMTSILRTTNTCKSKLSILETVIQRTKTAGGASNKVTKYIGNFKLACKKKDIEEVEMQLHHSVCILDLTMTMNLR